VGGLTGSAWKPKEDEVHPIDVGLAGLDHGIGHSRPPKAITECVRKL